MLAVCGDLRASLKSSFETNGVRIDLSDVS